MKTGLIYKAINTKNNKIYIGCTSNFKKRIAGHLTRAFYPNDTAYSNKFARAIRKYGKESFVWEIVEDNIPCENLEKIETAYIIKFDSINTGYNTIETTLANLLRGTKQSEEMKKRISDTKKGENYIENRCSDCNNIINKRYKKCGKCYLANFIPWNKGKKLGPLSEKHKSNLAKSHMGKRHTEETRGKIKEANILTSRKKLLINLA